VGNTCYLDQAICIVEHSVEFTVTCYVIFMLLFKILLFFYGYSVFARVITMTVKMQTLIIKFKKNLIYLMYSCYFNSNMNELLIYAKSLC
jgi:hypothetical protein